MNRELVNLKPYKKDPKIADKIKEIEDNTLLKQLKPLIIFDEADYEDSTYQTIIELAIALNYPVYQMSATFPGVPWSITSSFPIDRRIVNGFKAEHIKETDKSAIFVQSLNLCNELEAYLKKRNICYVKFDPTLAPAAEGITRGLQQGSIFIMTAEYGRGVTMDVDNVIISD